jgi:uncharacterized protein YkwD
VYHIEVMSKSKWILTIAFAATLITVPAVVFANANKVTVIPYVAPASVPLNADVIFAKVNEQRVQNGLKPLVRDARLDASAKAKADDMRTFTYNKHINPTTGKNGYTYVFDYAPGLCAYASENLSWDYQAENAVVDGWMGSKPHHDAILDPSYTISGLAVSGNKVVQHFCRQ